MNIQSGDFYITSFIVMFSMVISLILIIILANWWKNRRSPLIVTMATVLDKRIEARNSRHKNITFGYTTHKIFIYYITFLLEGGTQIELRVNKLNYSEIQKGYNGKLTFQGTKYIKFEKF